MWDRLLRRALLASSVGLIAIATPRSVDAASCVPGFDYGAFAKQCDLTFGGGAVTDSYNSALGTYATTVTNTGGNIGTNGTSNSCVKLNGSSTDINGNIDIGPGGNTSTTIQTTGGATFDSATVLTTPLSLPSVIIPVVGTPQGPRSFNSNASLAPNQTYGDVSVTAGATLTLSSGEYVMNSLKLTGNSILNLNITTGPVTIYIVADLDIAGGTVTNSSNQSTNLIFMVGPGCATVKLSGGAQSSFACYAPDSDITISGGGEIFGAVIGKTVKDVGGSLIHYDKALATIPAGQFACTANEVSRASPVVAVVEGNANPSIVQGTFETPTVAQPTFSSVAQLATWSFPYLKGHMRARVASTVTAASFTTGTVLFDAGATGNIPTAVNGGCATPNTSCRYVFTNTNTPNGLTATPTIKQLNDGNASAIGAIMTTALSGFAATEWTTIVRAVLGGKLGGVDRSTVALIEAGSVVGTGRSKIAYFGATDGMLHAVCASTGTAHCPIGSLGKELWAFMPRVQLPLVPGNTTRVDGSVRVLDVFGNFPGSVSGSPITAPSPASGRRAFRTVLIFHTGFSIGTKDAAYALDVTDPGAPVVLWEYATPTTAAALDFGTAMTVGAGPTLIGGQTKNLAVIETNNAGTTSTSTNGVVATALDIDTGALVWQFTHSYPSPPRGVAADAMPLPPQSVPGGAVPVDINNAGLGLVTHYVFGDLYGSVWRLDATTGKPPTSGSGFSCTHNDSTGDTALANCVPIFSFGANKKPIGSPPAVFARSAGGEQFVGFASGGYVDPVATIWSTTNQKLIALKLSPSTLPETDATAPCIATTCNLLVNVTFANATDKSFSAALIVGTKLLVTADNTDVNLQTYGTGSTATGSVYSADIGGGAVSGSLAVTSTAQRGAGQVGFDAVGGRAYTSTSESLVATTAGGVSVDPSTSRKLNRKLWLRSTL
ncbi:MAG: hypothetical protein H0V17_08885 [Deltaproteobacteria bacterium]|nr:hypothetical protein [Deltaproteobacteria bacterium]